MLGNQSESRKSVWRPVAGIMEYWVGYHRWRSAVLLLSVLASTAGYAEQVMRLESIVTGNQEQPKVMFVMPWQPIPTPEYTSAEAALLMPERLLKSYDAASLVRFTERARRASLLLSDEAALPGGDFKDSSLDR